MSAKLKDARGNLANTLYPWSPRDAISRLDPRLPVAMRTAEWTKALELLKSTDPPSVLPNLQFLKRQLTQFALGMQALDQRDLSRAEAASGQFDAELWRISNRLKDEADVKVKDKDIKADAAPPKLQVMPDAVPNPLVSYLSELLEAEKFDEFVERRCAKFYAAKYGRRSLTPGIYFRSLLLGY
ncbi:MAG: hypothetical protein WCB11_27795, partial [Terriglobales bacterium]